MCTETTSIYIATQNRLVMLVLQLLRCEHSGPLSRRSLLTGLVCTVICMVSGKLVFTRHLRATTPLPCRYRADPLLPPGAGAPRGQRRPVPAPSRASPWASRSRSSRSRTTARACRAPGKARPSALADGRERADGSELDLYALPHNQGGAVKFTGCPEQKGTISDGSGSQFRHLRPHSVSCWLALSLPVPARQYWSCWRQAFRTTLGSGSSIVPLLPSV